MFRSLIRRATKGETKATGEARAGTHSRSPAPNDQFSKVDHRPFSPRPALTGCRGALSRAERLQPRCGEEEIQVTWIHGGITKKSLGDAIETSNRIGVKHWRAEFGAISFVKKLVTRQQVVETAISHLAECFTETTPNRRCLHRFNPTRPHNSVTR